MIHEEICTYEVCKLAKEKGFDIPTHYAYNENRQKAMYMELCLNRNTKDSRSISAPTQSLLQRWLREKKNVHIAVFPNLRNSYKYVYIKGGERWAPAHLAVYKFDTYELALEDAELYCLKNLL